MADLIMTIDSDSDSEQPQQAKKQAKKNADVEEEILLAHSVIL